MDKWNNPIILEYIKYMGHDPIISLKKECDYLFQISSQVQQINSFVAIDIDKIAQVLKLKDDTFKYDKFLNSPGRIVQNSSNSIKIELSQDRSTFIFYRHRFIIAHEIGHWIIRSKINKIFSDEEKIKISKYQYEEELLCHYFASELLIPEDILSYELATKILNEDLIYHLYSKFKVPDYQIINRILFNDSRLIGIYWKNKSSPTSNYKTLRVLNFFPDKMFRVMPYIPINASAKTGRFSPNIILESYKKQKSFNDKVLISNFGDLSGYFDIFAFYPARNQSLFEELRIERKFDLITILSQKIK